MTKADLRRHARPCPSTMVGSHREGSGFFYRCQSCFWTNTHPANGSNQPQRKTRRVETAGSNSAFSGVSLYPPHRCFPSNGLAVLGSLIPSCRLGRLRLFLDWACRQLQYGSPLPRSEVSDKNDCTVREFQRVVMLESLVEVNLAKPR